METDKTGLDKVLESKDYDLVVEALNYFESHLSIRAEKELDNEGKLMMIAMKRVNLGKLIGIFKYAKEYNK